MNIEYKSNKQDFTNIQINLYFLSSSYYIKCDSLSKVSFSRIMLEGEVEIVITQVMHIQIVFLQ